ncbi:hypothetical protein T492DRAFT_946261 [Pavlovales sp. CCMP2436]|nr:hypothetical protein T492DRAFT_946261 [Pavlovales sp. CCMP2436]|mmetsp:Transcript_15530/g.39455  ORF Transcript_15530/g.39455 Transcript_15530/m.39455 type:complete len:299 (-) Transcript_15530:228-1124(-)
MAGGARGTPERVGLWPEGSLIDKLDKFVSYHAVFRWQLGLLELPLAVPGTWFGTTTTSLGSAPLLIAAVAEPGNTRLAAVAVAIFVGALVAFCLVVTGRADRELLWWKPPVFVLTSVGIARLLSPTAVHIVSFYVACWGYAVLSGSLLKTVFARRRPCISVEGCELLDELRLLPLHEHLCAGYTAIESFPSGDACGGAVASSALYLATGGVSWLVWLPMLFSMYGRMYIWAHHLLDVVAGAVVGVAISFALNRVCPWREFSLLQLLICMGIFTLGRKGIVKLRPQLPVELTAGKHYYG